MRKVFFVLFGEIIWIVCVGLILNGCVWESFGNESVGSFFG